MVRFVSSRAGLFVLLSMTACGGADDEQAERNCGPNGRLHIGVGVEPHCDCDDGFEARDGTCVEAQPSDSPALPAPTPTPTPTPTTPDCGENGNFDGVACECEPGYTQTGLGDLRTCEAVPACAGVDDGYEPNDAPAQAVLWSSVESPLYSCPADADWFVFPVTAGDAASVELRFNGEEVDLDLFLFGPSSRDPRAFSIEVSGDIESARFVARADGSAGVLVLPYGIGEGAYELSVSVEAGEVPECVGFGGFCRSSSDCCSGICHIDHCH